MGASYHFQGLVSLECRLTLHCPGLYAQVEPIQNHLTEGLVPLIEEHSLKGLGFGKEYLCVRCNNNPLLVERLTH